MSIREMQKRVFRAAAKAGSNMSNDYVPSRFKGYGKPCLAMAIMLLLLVLICEHYPQCRVCVAMRRGKEVKERLK